MPSGDAWIRLVPEVGVEPTRPKGSRDFESRASADSATLAWRVKIIRTKDGAVKHDHAQRVRAMLRTAGPRTAHLTGCHTDTVRRGEAVQPVCHLRSSGQIHTREDRSQETALWRPVKPGRVTQSSCLIRVVDAGDRWPESAIRQQERA